MNRWCQSPWALLACSGVLASGLELEFQSGPGQIAGMDFQRLAASREPATPGAWSMELAGLSHTRAGGLGNLRIDCADVRLAEMNCRTGQIAWQHPDGREFRGHLLGAEESVVVELDVARARIRFGRESLGVVVETLPLDWLPPDLLARLDLSYLAGRADLEVRLADDELFLRARLAGLGLDTPDGSLAADGIGLDLDLEWSGERFRLELVQDTGEWLFGPLYLPPPDRTVTVSAAGRAGAGDSIVLDHWRLRGPGVLDLSGTLELTPGEAGPELTRLAVHFAELDLGAAWSHWFESLAASYGFAGMEASGQVRGRMELGPGGFEHLAVILDELDLVDGQERFRVHGLEGGLSFRDEGGSLELDLTWQDAGLRTLPLGGARLAVATDAAGAVRLGQPLELPVLDGALVVDRFVWHDWRSEVVVLEMDARLEPIDLAALTLALELPVLGGRLSGRFPGIEYAGGVLAFAGGIDIEAFSGRIQVTDLNVERPFGTLPALSADFTAERLDLLELTGAFNFGRITGLMSGSVTGLRLLDWQPVAFDARFQTHEDAPGRRISQRAVDNLSSLGGAGGGAMLSGTLLRVFEDFPYRRAGFSCRLANNICRMDGVAPHESGGYYLVEGRQLPRLDIIGHRRLVDWPRLVGQLRAVTEQ